MTRKTKQKTKIKSALSGTREEFVKKVFEERKWDDLKLRYSSQYAIDYIERSCNNGYFVEAYCIAQQYIILSIEKIFPGIKKYLKNRKISEFYLIAFLNGIGFLSNDLYSKWEKLIEERNDKAHDLIDNPQKIDRLSKTKKKEIVKFLVGCIEAADIFFIDTFKSLFKRKQIEFRPENPQIAHLVDIAIKRIRKSGSKWPILSKKRSIELIKKEIIAMFAT